MWVVVYSGSRVVHVFILFSKVSFELLLFLFLLGFLPPGPPPTPGSPPPSYPAFNPGFNEPGAGLLIIGLVYKLRGPALVNPSASRSGHVPPPDSKLQTIIYPVFTRWLIGFHLRGVLRYQRHGSLKKQLCKTKKRKRNHIWRPKRARTTASVKTINDLRAETLEWRLKGFHREPPRQEQLDRWDWLTGVKEQQRDLSILITHSFTSVSKKLEGSLMCFRTNILQRRSDKSVCTLSDWTLCMLIRTLFKHAFLCNTSFISYFYGVGLSVSRITQELLRQFSLNSAEGCNKGQEGTR